MIQQGTDGLSQGDFSSRGMQGKDFLHFLPFNESALERQENLEKVIKSWLKNPEGWLFTSTEDWFDLVFTNPEGKWIWTPSPVFARVAVEQLCEVKHTFPNSQHVFVCPALMTGYRHKLLEKIVDSMFSVKAGCCIWNESNFEPLTFAFVKPFLISPPWKVRHLPAVDLWERAMSEVQWKGSHMLRHHIRKFWC